MASSKTRKVRVACQRCRSRRIKCDGGVPACSNCAKAGIACVDVAAHDADQLVPRSFATDANARIEWLEDVIRTHLPTFDLKQGPQIETDASFRVTSQQSAQVGESTEDTGEERRQTPCGTSNHSGSTAVSNTPKRSFTDYAEPSREQAFSSEARSVASNLGMLSLNSDSREKHYLGSSSGLLFSNLIQTGPSTSESRSSMVSSQSRSRPLRSRENFHRFYDALDMTLPIKLDALFLFDTYFQYAYYEHPVLHPQSVYDCLDALYPCKNNSDESRPNEKGWPPNVRPFSYNGEIETTEQGPAIAISLQTAMFHVFMVLTLAATSRVREGNFDFAPTQFYQVVELVSPDTLAETSVASLQAIYLLAHHAFMAPAKLNIWTLDHVCMAHAIDIGLHRSPNATSRSANITRRLLFYCVYSLDRSVATIQGRPLGIRDETFDVEIPTFLEIESDLDAGDLPNNLKQCIKDAFRYSLHRFKLSFIISKIKTQLYHLPARSKENSTDHHRNMQKDLHAELESWRTHIEDFPSQLNVEDDAERRKWHLKLELLYHSTVVLLFQPSQTFRQPSDDAFNLCFGAAMQEMFCFQQLHEQDALFLGWRNAQAIFSCGATIMYCFWTSKAVQNSTLSEKIPAILRLCVNFLTIGSVWWPSVKKGKVSFERLVEITLQRHGDLQAAKRDGSLRKKPRVRQPRLQGRTQEEGILRTVSSEVPQPITSAAGVCQGSGDFEIAPGNQELNLEYDPAWQQTNMQNPVVGDQSYDSSVVPMVADTELSYLNEAFTTSSSFVEPEIELFLNDYFLSEDMWNPSLPGPPMSFHFGDL